MLYALHVSAKWLVWSTFGITLWIAGAIFFQAVCPILSYNQQGQNYSCDIQQRKFKLNNYY